VKGYTYSYEYFDNNVLMFVQKHRLHYRKLNLAGLSITEIIYTNEKS